MVKYIYLISLVGLMLTLNKYSVSKEAIPVSVPITRNEYNTVITTQYNHLLTNQFINLSINFRKAQKSDLIDLQDLVNNLLEKAEISKPALRQRIKAALQNELKYIQTFDSAIINFKGYDIYELPLWQQNPQAALWPVKVNKVALFMAKAIEIADGDIAKILQSSYIKEIFKDGFLPSPEQLNDNVFDPRSDSTIPASTIVFLAALKTLSNTEFVNYTQAHINRNSLFYCYQTPKETDINHNSIFYFNDTKLKNGFIIVHNGYAYGDSIGIPDGRNNFSSSPHDCAGIITHFLFSQTPNKIQYTIFTEDMLIFYNFMLRNGGYINQQLMADKLFWYGMLQSKVTPLSTVNLKITDIKEGDIVFFRKFTDKSPQNSSGAGGHVFIVLGTDGKDKIYGISYMRQIEDLGVSGLLMSAFSLQSLKTSTYKYGLLRLK